MDGCIVKFVLNSDIAAIQIFADSPKFFQGLESSQLYNNFYSLIQTLMFMHPGYPEIYQHLKDCMASYGKVIMADAFSHFQHTDLSESEILNKIAERVWAKDVERDTFEHRSRASIGKSGLSTAAIHVT